MTQHQPYAPPAVAYDADGRPYYLPAAAPAAPVALYQPAAQQPVIYQPAPVPQPAQSSGGYHLARDPWVARLLAGGIGLGAAALGLGFLLQALAAATTALGLLLGILALIWLLAHSGGGRGAVNVRVDQRVTNRRR
jgi:hypothetical protein